MDPRQPVKKVTVPRVEINGYHGYFSLTNQFKGGFFPGFVHDQASIPEGGHLPCRKDPQGVPLLQVGHGLFEAHDGTLHILSVLEGVHREDKWLQGVDPLQEEIGNDLVIRPLFQKEFEK